MVTPWMTQMQCVAQFTLSLSKGAPAPPPVAKKSSEYLSGAASFKNGVTYDAAHGIALLVTDHDHAWGTIQVLKIGPPPSAARAADLSGVHTTSNIAVGTPESEVVRLLGAPERETACGATLFRYTIFPEIPNELVFSLAAGRVTGIYVTYGD
ncbi:MAG: hypothetical protein JOZ38_04210 [Candidatus Eremiobacteraeota bacterium]|nr:hypothetical protein [Candidatus Eremiobacteraeota bacterium]